MPRYEDIQKAFLNGEYSVTLNKVHTTDSRITVHEVMSPEKNKEVYDFVIRAISTYGAKDVAPVVHAKWIDKNHQMMGSCPCCTNCNGFNPIETKYCPNCGARMDDEIKRREELKQKAEGETIDK